MIAGASIKCLPYAAFLSDAPRAQVLTMGDWLAELMHASVARRIGYFLGGARKYRPRQGKQNWQYLQPYF